MTLYERIKKFAKLRGMKITEVAERAGLSNGIIYRWKSPDSNPSKASIIAVAKALGVTYEELTGTSETPEPTKIDLGASLDDDSVIMTFEGKPIPEEDRELIKRLLRGK